MLPPRLSGAPARGERIAVLAASGREVLEHLLDCVIHVLLGFVRRRTAHPHAESLARSRPSPAELIRHRYRIEVRASLNPRAGCKYELEGVLSRERYGDGRPEAKR